MRQLSVFAFVLLVLPGFAFGATIFFENFESGLGNWTAGANGGPGGVIVTDPVQGDGALAFNRNVGGGDIFTSTAFFDPSAGGNYILHFDYLGTLPTSGNNGGYIGISLGLPGTHFWLDGTGPGAAAATLVDDGQWHSYQIAITQTNPFHIMIEDFNTGVFNALFDNIYLTDSAGISPPAASAPLPAPVSLAGLGLFIAFLAARRKRK